MAKAVKQTKPETVKATLPNGVDYAIRDNGDGSVDLITVIRSITIDDFTKESGSGKNLNLDIQGTTHDVVKGLALPDGTVLHVQGVGGGAVRCQIANPIQRVHEVISEVMSWVTLEHLVGNSVPTTCESLPDILKVLAR